MEYTNCHTMNDCSNYLNLPPDIERMIDEEAEIWAGYEKEHTPPIFGFPVVPTCLATCKEISRPFQGDCIPGLAMRCNLSVGEVAAAAMRVLQATGPEKVRQLYCFPPYDMGSDAGLKCDMPTAYGELMILVELSDRVPKRFRKVLDTLNGKAAKLAAQQDDRVITYWPDRARRFWIHPMVAMVKDHVCYIRADSLKEHLGVSPASYGMTAKRLDHRLWVHLEAVIDLCETVNMELRPKAVRICWATIRRLEGNII